MIRKVILLCFSLLTVGAIQNEDKSKVAVSSQSFSRPDIPISYEFHNVHEYKQKQHAEKEPEKKYSIHNNNDLKKPTIQYAPIIQNHEEHLESAQSFPYHYDVNKNGVVIKSKDEHMDPKILKQNVHHNAFLGFLPKNNDYDSTTEHYLKQEASIAPPANSHYHEVNQPTVNHQNPTPDTFVASTPKHLATEMQNPAEDYKFHQFLPTDNSTPLKSYQKLVQYIPTIHQQQNIVPSQIYYQDPRLHLNIARAHSIAKQTQEARKPQILISRSPQVHAAKLSLQNLANFLPTNSGKQVFTTAFHQLPTSQHEPGLSMPYSFTVARNTNHLGKAHEYPAFYLQELSNQPNTVMVPVQSSHVHNNLQQYQKLLVNNA